jgi:hypothetical protein
MIAIGINKIVLMSRALLLEFNDDVSSRYQSLRMNKAVSIGQSIAKDSLKLRCVIVSDDEF